MQQNPLDLLVDLVEKHYSDEAATPLKLSTLGQKLGDDRPFLLARYGRLSDAVEAAGGERLQLLNTGQPGQVTVVTPARREAVERQMAVGGSAGSTSFDKLPAPVKIAFVVRTEPGESVAVRTSAPIKYLRLPQQDAPPQGFTLLDPRYRRPGLVLQNASVADKEDLWRAYLEWTSATNLDADLLAVQKPAGNALERLLNAQPTDIVGRMNLPADIVALLLRHS